MTGIVGQLRDPMKPQGELRPLCHRAAAEIVQLRHLIQTLSGEGATEAEAIADLINKLRPAEGAMNTVTESIFSGKQAIVPLADVQHIEPWSTHSVPGIRVITKHTRWDRDAGDWANSIWISDPEAAEFRRAWCHYRSELEADTLANLEPSA